MMYGYSYDVPETGHLEVHTAVGVLNRRVDSLHQHLVRLYLNPESDTYGFSGSVCTPATHTLTRLPRLQGAALRGHGSFPEQQENWESGKWPERCQNMEIVLLL